MLEDVSYYLLLFLPKLKQYEASSLFLKWQIAGVLWWRGHGWTVSAWQGERWSAEVWLEFSEHLCHKLCQPRLSSSQRTHQLNCATKRTLTHFFFLLSTLSYLQLLPPSLIIHFRIPTQSKNYSPRNAISSQPALWQEEIFFPPSPHCPYVERDLLSRAVRQHTLALCHMSSLSMDTKAVHSNGDLCCPPGDNAASFKQAGKRRCLSTSIMEVLRVCVVFLSARPNSIGPFPKWELWRGWLVCLNFSSCLVSSSVIGMERKGGVYSRKGETISGLNKKKNVWKRISLFSFSTSKLPSCAFFCLPACSATAFSVADLLHLSGQKMMRRVD